MFDIQEIRSQFSILEMEVNGKPLVYLDNAATSQKPNSVLEVCHAYYTELNANVHRGIHTLSSWQQKRWNFPEERFRSLSTPNMILK